MDHSVTGNEEDVELGEAVVGGIGLPLCRCVLKVFVSVFLDKAESLRHALRLTYGNLMHVHEVLDVLCVLFEL